MENGGEGVLLANQRPGFFILPNQKAPPTPSLSHTCLRFFTSFLKCFLHYNLFLSNTKFAKKFDDTDIMLPRIVLCLNSIHSPRKIERNYPWMQNITGLLYSGNTPAKLFESYERRNKSAPLKTFLKSEFNEANIISKKERGHMIRDFMNLIPYLDQLKNHSVYDFLEDTYSEFSILACRVGPNFCNDDWKNNHFQEGKCMVFNPMTNVSTLNIVIGYESDDWGPGWTNFMEGLTMFYSANYQKTLNFKKSLQLTSKSIPIVKFIQQKKKMLGAPYSICRKNYEQKFQFMSQDTIYTEKHCVFECKIKMIIDVCNCYPPFAPVHEQYGRMRNCTLFDHMSWARQLAF
jgi:hypothetical protein